VCTAAQDQQDPRSSPTEPAVPLSRGVTPQLGSHIYAQRVLASE
jgi:hypothetical protein